MLRKRSRAVTTKQALMPDQNFPSPPSQNHTKPVSSFLISPRFFNGFLSKNPFESDTKSPTSVLDTKPFTPAINHPFGYDEKNNSKPTKIFSGNKHPWEKLDTKGIGLAIVDSLNDEKTDKYLNSRMVLFGSKLKIQIPPIPPSPFSPTQSPNSPADFGIKTRNSPNKNSFSPAGFLNSSNQTKESSPQAFSGFLSASEMELSEDYTCVISHGPNPKTTIIYDNCIVESGWKKEFNSSPENPISPPGSFLSFCFTCKKNLELGKDIYIYRGEKAFCSSECRCQEMLFDEVENP